MHVLTLIMMLLNLVLGVVITFLALSIGNDIQNAQCSGQLRTANTGCIVLGVILATASLSFGVCEFSKGNLSPDNSVIERRTLLTYYSFILCLSVVLIILGTIIRDEADKGKVNSVCKKAKDKATAIMTIGIVALVVCLLPVAIVVGRMGYKRFSKTSSM